MNKTLAITSPVSAKAAETRATARAAIFRVLDAGEKGIRILSFAMAAAGAACMVLMLVLVCANIGMRPFGGSIRGAVEAGGYICALAVGLCMPGAQLAGSHIGVGLLTDRLSPAPRFVQTALVNIACGVFLFLAGREVLDIAAYARDMGEHMEGFDLSYYGIAAGLAAGLFTHALIFFHSLASLLAGGHAKNKEAV